jgi:putative Ca2+/H+ antiporter (TMEM165/GDT1 family)
VEALLLSAGVIALAEIGDKTQLLAFMMAARFKAPGPILAGMAVATLVNHALASALGVWMTTVLSPTTLRWVLGLIFLGMALWSMTADDVDVKRWAAGSRTHVFGASLVTFFVAEMGDKTQVATVAMAAHYGTALPVILGTSLGMLLVDGPVVLLGYRLGAKIPMKLVHSAAAGIFAALGLATLLHT